MKRTYRESTSGEKSWYADRLLAGGSATSAGRKERETARRKVTEDGEEDRILTHPRLR